MKDMHIDYDYSKVTVTSNPEYYRNTQHLFAELYEA
jgi:leucyl-tRNA synthetase